MLSNRQCCSTGTPQTEKCHWQCAYSNSWYVTLYKYHLTITDPTPSGKKHWCAGMMPSTSTTCRILNNYRNIPSNFTFFQVITWGSRTRLFLTHSNGTRQDWCDWSQTGQPICHQSGLIWKGLTEKIHTILCIASNKVVDNMMQQKPLKIHPLVLTDFLPNPGNSTKPATTNTSGNTVPPQTLPIPISMSNDRNLSAPNSNLGLDKIPTLAPMPYQAMSNTRQSGQQW